MIPYRFSRCYRYIGGDIRGEKVARVRRHFSSLRASLFRAQQAEIIIRESFSFRDP